MRAATQDEVIRSAWIEWLVARVFNTGDGERFIPDVAEVPRWFVLYELGLSPIAGPSIFWTVANLARINRGHRRQLDAEERAPRTERRERLVARTRRNEWRAILKFRRAPLPACA